MKRTALNLIAFMELVENDHVKIGRYEYTRDVDADGNSHFYRTYKAGDTVIHEEVTPFN
jgi:hypothetical protein